MTETLTFLICATIVVMVALVACLFALESLVKEGS